MLLLTLVKNEESSSHAIIERMPKEVIQAVIDNLNHIHKSSVSIRWWERREDGELRNHPPRSDCTLVDSTQGFSINQVVHLHMVCCDAAQHTQDSTHSTHCTPLSGVPIIIKFHLMNAFMS